MLICNVLGISRGRWEDGKREERERNGRGKGGRKYLNSRSSTVVRDFRVQDVVPDQVGGRGSDRYLRYSQVRSSQFSSVPLMRF